MAGYSPAQYAAEAAAKLAASELELAPPLPPPAADTAAKFQPDYTPEQLESLGVYDSLYRGQGPRLASLGEWKPEWISEHDPKGWAQWYKRYAAGRRIPEEDERQMKRWLNFKSRHGGPFVTNPTPRRGWALRNWGIDPSKLVEPEQQNKITEMLENYKNKKTQQHIAEKQADLLPSVQLQEHQQRIQDTVDDENPRMIVYHGLGSGKSLSALAAAEAAKQKYNEDYGIVAPASLKGNFQKEVEKFTTGSKPEILSYTGMGLGKKFTNQPQTVIMDEAHRLRNPGGAAAQAAAEAAQNAKRLLLLTGSPITNSPSDLANLISLVTKKPISPQDFEKRYIGHKTVHPGIINYLAGIKPGVQPVIRNEDELKSLLKGHVDYQPSKTPEGVNVNEEKIQVPLTAQQQKIQKALRTKIPPGFLWKLDQEFPLGKDELAKLNSFLTGLRQNSVSTRPFRLDNDAFKAFEQSGKLQEAYKRLNEMLESDPRKKAIIYSNHIGAGVEPYAAALAANNIPHGIFHGGIPTRQRQKALADYNAGKLRALLIGPAGAEGLSTKGTNLIQLLDPHWHESRSQQARGRGLRFDSHDDLPEELKNVAVQRFISKSEEPSFLGKLMGYRRERTGDEILERLSNEKEKINERFRQLLREVGTKKAAQKFGYDLGNRPESTNVEAGYAPAELPDMSASTLSMNQVLLGGLAKSFAGDKSIDQYIDSYDRLTRARKAFTDNYKARMAADAAAIDEDVRMHGLIGTAQHNRHTQAVDRAVIDLNAPKSTAPNPVQTATANFGPKPSLPPAPSVTDSPTFNKLPGIAVKPQPAQPKPITPPIKTSAHAFGKTAASSPAWQRSEGKNDEGGLNAKGRASYNNATGGNLKAPVTESNPDGERAKRQNSFCSRMCGMKRVNTGAKAKSDPDSRINKSLRKWNCKCGSVNPALVAFGKEAGMFSTLFRKTLQTAAKAPAVPAIKAAPRLSLETASPAVAPALASARGVSLSQYPALADKVFARGGVAGLPPARPPHLRPMAAKSDAGGIRRFGDGMHSTMPAEQQTQLSNAWDRWHRAINARNAAIGAPKNIQSNPLPVNNNIWGQLGVKKSDAHEFGKEAGFRWYKRFPMTENVALNLSLGGPSLTVKKLIPGASFTLGNRAPRVYVGTPIPGLAYQQYISPKKHKIKAEKEFKDAPEEDKDDLRGPLEKIKDFWLGSDYDKSED